MTIVAIIPARGGSKGLPNKNLLEVGDLTLLARSILTAQNVEDVESVFVSSDSKDILDEAIRYGAIPINRPSEFASDMASSESALLHAVESLEVRPEIVVFMQVTTPFSSSLDISRAIDLVKLGSFDSVFSARKTHANLWEREPSGRAIPTNRPQGPRLRRQDIDPQFEETGGFYVFTTTGFVSNSNRFFGRVGIVEVSERLHVDIDSEDDLELARYLWSKLPDSKT